MRHVLLAIRRVAYALCVIGASAGYAGNVCDAEKAGVQAGTERHFVVFAGRTQVFFERSGPTFVMLMRAGADEAEIGAFGIHADAGGKPVFGAVPASEYARFLRDGAAASGVMLRVEVSEPQYQRVLGILRNWDRRVRERALLYPDVAMDNILLVKQASEELNRCEATLVPYRLDWGLEDEVSEHNIALRIPFEYFRTLKQLNASRHVPDSAMPAALLE
jgi:hypothetical protein